MGRRCGSCSASEYDFGVPTLAELIGPTLEKKVRENSALKAEAESLVVEGRET
jgi:hypothetical protein